MAAEIHQGHTGPTKEDKVRRGRFQCLRSSEQILLLDLQRKKTNTEGRFRNLSSSTLLTPSPVPTGILYCPQSLSHQKSPIDR